MQRTLKNLNLTLTEKTMENTLQQTGNQCLLKMLTKVVYIYDNGSSLLQLISMIFFLYIPEPLFLGSIILCNKKRME